MIFARLNLALTVVSLLQFNIADLVHVNLVPCPGLGNNAFESNCIVPDLIDSSPAAPLTIVYPDGSRVYYGNELTPQTVSVPPSTISWTADTNRLYTLSKSDPDARSRQHRTVGPINHWLVVNIPGTDIDRGNVVKEYAGAAPGEGTGLHRYVFLAFEQQDKIDPTTPSNVALRSNISHFEIRKYASENGLGYPIAGNFYVAQYSDFLAGTRAQHSYHSTPTSGVAVSGAQAIVSSFLQMLLSTLVLFR